MIIRSINLNPETLIARQSDEIDYSDVFQVKTSLLQEPPELQDCMVAFFKSFSPVLTKMIISREVIARSLGLKTASPTTPAERDQYFNQFQGNIGDSIAIFDVLDRNDTELLTGQTDKHLDFMLSFITYKEAESTVLELATTVKFHNSFGKIYFFFVKPFHRFFMKRILKKMIPLLLQQGKN